jgi:hypothetical protein
MEDSVEKQPDIKEFIRYLHGELENFEKIMYLSKQEYENIRTESRNLESRNQEDTNDITNRILDDVEKLEKDFKTLMSEEKSESSFLKQQLAALTQEKMKLEQNCLLLGTRLDEAERNVGIEISLPSIVRGKHK